MSIKLFKFLLSVLAVMFCIATTVGVTFAQTEAPGVEQAAIQTEADMGMTAEDFGADIDEAENIEDYDLVYGAVKEVQAASIIVSQFDEETEADVDVMYTTDDETTLDGVENIADLKAGDEVEVMFQDMEGKKIVRLLTKMIDVEMEEDIDAPENMEAPAPEEQVIESEGNAT